MQVRRFLTRQELGKNVLPDLLFHIGHFVVSFLDRWSLLQILPVLRKWTHSVRLSALHMDQSTAMKAKVRAIFAAFCNRSVHLVLGGLFLRVCSIQTFATIAVPRTVQNKVSLTDIRNWPCNQ